MICGEVFILRLPLKEIWIMLIMVLIIDENNKKEVKPMNDGQSDVWKEKESVVVKVGDGKVDFNRRNLKKFFLTHKDRSQITKETILDFFNEDSLSKEDPETGCYISHLLFLDGNYNFRYFMREVFEFVSPKELNRDGQLYIDCAFQSHMRLSSFMPDYSKLLKEAIVYYGIDVNEHFDNQGNNLLHWIATGNAVEHFTELAIYFEQYMYYEKNNYGVSLSSMKQLASKMSEQTHIPRGIEAVGDYVSIYRKLGNDIPFLPDVFSPFYVFSKEDKVMQKFITYGQWKRIYDYIPDENHLKQYKFGSFKK